MWQLRKSPKKHVKHKSQFKIKPVKSIMRKETIKKVPPQVKAPKGYVFYWQKWCKYIDWKGNMSRYRFIQIDLIDEEIKALELNARAISASSVFTKKVELFNIRKEIESLKKGISAKQPVERAFAKATTPQNSCACYRSRTILRLLLSRTCMRFAFYKKGHDTSLSKVIIFRHIMQKVSEKWIECYAFEYMRVCYVGWICRGLLLGWEMFYFTLRNQNTYK